MKDILKITAAVLLVLLALMSSAALTHWMLGGFR
jgi:hypothetical protein